VIGCVTKGDAAPRLFQAILFVCKINSQGLNPVPVPAAETYNAVFGSKKINIALI
jgi:hypothetical protein